jgi:hypothetical protein
MCSVSYYGGAKRFRPSFSWCHGDNHGSFGESRAAVRVHFGANGIGSVAGVSWFVRTGNAGERKWADPQKIWSVAEGIRDSGLIVWGNYMVCVQRQRWR